MTKNVLFFIIAICCLSIIILCIFPTTSFSNYYNGSFSKLGVSSILKKDDVLLQELTCNLYELDAIDLRFNTNHNSSKIRVDISGLNEEVFTKIIDNSEILNDGFYHIELPHQKNMKGKTINIKVSYEKYDKKSELRYVFVTDNENEILKLNDDEELPPLLIGVFGREKDYSSIWYPLMTISICIALLPLKGGKDGKE